MIRATNGAILGYANFFSKQTQTAELVDTPYPIMLEEMDFGDGSIHVEEGSKIYIENDGPYNMSFSLQIESTNSSTQTVNIWVRYNGVDYPWSNTKINVLNGPNVAAWNIFGEAKGGGYVQLMWSTTSKNVSIKTYPANAIHPAVPSVILTFARLNQV